MRAFIAIELPANIKDFLSRLENKLKTTGADVKWVSPGNIHLTLKFLGEINAETIEKISVIMEDIAKNKKTFQIHLGAMGAFPNTKFPRVIWIGINSGEDEAKEIVKELEKELNKIGIPREVKPFSGHITIARIRSNKDKENLVQELNKLNNNTERDNPPAFAVTKFILFKSTLTPQGPIYEVLKEANLIAN